MRAPHVLGALCVALLSLTACSSGSSTSSVSPDPPPSSSSSTTPQPPPCEVTAKVDGVGYHQRGVYGDYDVDRDHPLTGPLLLCRGGRAQTVTFYAIVDVPQRFAVAAELKGRPVFFLADDLPPVPSDSTFARIMVGRQAH